MLGRTTVPVNVGPSFGASRFRVVPKPAILLCAISAVWLIFPSTIVSLAILLEDTAPSAIFALITASVAIF